MIGPVEDAVLQLVRALASTQDEAALLMRQVLKGEAWIAVSADAVVAYPGQLGEATIASTANPVEARDEMTASPNGSRSRHLKRLTTKPE